MKTKRLFLSLLFVAPLGLSATSCSKSSSTGDHTIRVLNLEDYIYIDEEDESNNLTHQFEEYANELFGYDDVKVVYDTSDTNESEYNDLLTGRINYDLVCTSDYMLQKFVREGLVEKLDKDALENYHTYASKEIKQRLDEIEVVKDGKTEVLEDYAVGYMWGTLGLLINPNYSLMADNDIDMDTVISDAQSWDILWDERYYNTASIKNSMRDTYAVALMHGYDNELEELKLRHQDPNDELYDDEAYNSALSKIFNLTDEEKTLPLVKDELNELKDNIFGMEVDSGKQDIVTGKIGLNLAWSGDAVYSMDQAEDPELVSDPFELYYAIPENGSNIWFDGWAIPTNENRSDETYELAMAFLDFLCDPEIAALNMDYSGYTSFIGGDDILELVRDWYDVRAGLISYEDEIEVEEGVETVYYDVYYEDPETGEEVASDYSDCHFLKDNDDSYNDVELYYYDDEENKQIIMMEDEDGNEVKATYNTYFILDEYEEVDLSYFFNGTLSEDYTEEDMIFYSDCYLPYESEDGNISVGRQFFCQYPSAETLNRCAIMVDYGDDNIKIVKLWEDFKSNPLPVWAIVLIIVEVVVALFVILYFWLSKSIKKTLRARRSLENSAK